MFLGERQTFDLGQGLKPKAQSAESEGGVVEPTPQYSSMLQRGPGSVIHQYFSQFSLSRYHLWCQVGGMALLACDFNVN